MTFGLFYNDLSLIPDVLQLVLAPMQTMSSLFHSGHDFFGLVPNNRRVLTIRSHSFSVLALSPSRFVQWFFFLLRNISPKFMKQLLLMYKQSLSVFLIIRWNLPAGF